MRASRDALGQRLALDQLEHEETLAVGLLEPVDGADMRMVERGEDLRFAPEPREAVGDRA